MIRKPLTVTGSGFENDPCQFKHPDFPDVNIFPIKWGDFDTFGTFETKMANDKEYDGGATWEQGFERCIELGMYLPLPTNEEENSDLIGFILQRNRVLGSQS